MMKMMMMPKVMLDNKSLFSDTHNHEVLYEIPEQIREKFTFLLKSLKKLVKEHENLPDRELFIEVFYKYGTILREKVCSNTALSVEEAAILAIYLAKEKVIK